MKRPPPDRRSKVAPPDFLEMMQHLHGLRDHFPKVCTNEAIRDLGRRIYVLEKGRRTHFGGIEVLAWHLLQKAKQGTKWLELISYVERLYYERRAQP